MELPLCSCGYTVKCENRIYQLTDAPYIVKDDSADVKYIGYEDIGEYYSGKSLLEKINIDGIYKQTAQIIGNGVLLDLACGDGLFTIPLAAQNISVISMDISDKMLDLVYKRAEIAELDPACLTVCRANALDIPLMDCSVDAVIANSMLHLISTPEFVIKEIHRVLKKGGKFITFEDKPSSSNVGNDDLTEEEKADNKKADELSNLFHGRYFEILKNEYNIYGTRYSWKFDREKICSEIFNHKKIYPVERKINKTKSNFKDGFLHRMGGKGFSDQSDVPFDIHKSVFDRVMAEFTEKYGEKALEIGWNFSDRYETTEIITYIK
jgi:ubiquinone/menaquinone biosynthesis C-methylase UbiE